MTAPAHPQRCDTCKNDCYWRGRGAYAFIYDMGCASHSSAQSRDQVLDELLKWLDGDWTFTKVKHYGKWINQKSLNYDHVVGYIKSLRTQGSRDR